MDFNRITFDANIMGGKACIRGMRITVSLIVNLIANGSSFSDIKNSYAYIEDEDIKQALHYAAWTADDMLAAI